MCAPRYHTLAAARPALAAISSSRRAIAFVAATAILGTLFYQLRRRAGGCNPAPMCRIWSCSKPLAASLEDEWPSWPPVSRNGIPRDNLPGWSAEVRWRSLHRQQAAAAAAAAPQTRLVFLGDSITEGWLRSGFSGTAPSIPQPVNEQLWHDAFGLWSPLNLAIGGDRVQDLGWRLQRGGLLARALRPTIFAVMVGTNDLGAGESWRVVADEVTTLNGRLAAYAWKRPWVRWVDCGDRFLAPGYAPADQAASATPDGDLMLAEPLGAPHARAHQVKRNASSAAGPGGRHLQPHLMYDLLHLTPEGYTRWAECLRPAIAEAFAWNANRTRRQ
ncbi:hypothetical protein EMIHUDRAFT_464202 [Emiliania huxleyi CCMP1516]|uniref:SGNH hydrolase-type esterase domain-containing protein n=2 Tax=Emiliania huxleyi TaxID=2903 RepID=A0A0D3J1I9_EMIH1|nr:hypothetical protein EMIHUDRAFT_464202 [Emiliania huxleyi CCMP1516]EOD17374.1 hypothetical protein EMIHUDRAFT_464202 [Emiliania huxleyi CCMP1516]|eukprot:XP_005769803.1 hypothetical protein EMIHUDRAFT_464202 [Emiliania huxleyi CCMP1516]